MAASAHVPDFTPSANALRFTNSFPHEPDVTINLGRAGSVGIGDASRGLCGGMVFAVRDLFEAHALPPAETEPPHRDNPMFGFLVRRLIDSFNLPLGVVQYYRWMATPGHDAGIGSLTRHGVSRMTIVDNWPEIRADIDAGHPSPLGLVTVASLNPGDLGKNHQVLAYAYDIDDSARLTLSVYDPNTGADDGVRLSLNLSTPSREAPITHNIAIAEPVRGFFRVRYRPADLTSILAARESRPAAP
jgi:hypothetical protein